MGYDQVSKAQQRWVLVEAVRSGVSVAEASRLYGVSRVTAHKWLRRAWEEGLSGMADRSHRPHRLGWLEGSAQWEQRLREARERYPGWGSKKLRVYLEHQHGSAGLPSLSTIGRWLCALGLSRRRRWRKRGPRVERPERTTARVSNDVWGIDFKGHFCTGDGARCDTLTITDLASRCVLCCQVMASLGREAVQGQMRRVFARHGLPSVIRCDNGQPFGSPGPLGLSKLSVWWVRLGIRVEHSRPGKPQDNGSHERMHRTLKADTLRPPAPTLVAQQERYDQWRDYFNTTRPHEALAMGCPARFYQPSPRRYRAPRPLRYPTGWEVRRVKAKGEISWQGPRRFIGEAFAGQRVGLKPIDDKITEVYFANLLLGVLGPGDRAGLRPTVYVRPAPPDL